MFDHPESRIWKQQEDKLLLLLSGWLVIQGRTIHKVIRQGFASQGQVHTGNYNDVCGTSLEWQYKCGHLTKLVDRVTLWIVFLYFSLKESLVWKDKGVIGPDQLAVKLTVTGRWTWKLSHSAEQSPFTLSWTVFSFSHLCFRSMRCHGHSSCVPIIQNTSHNLDSD